MIVRDQDTKGCWHTITLLRPGGVLSIIPAEGWRYASKMMGFCNQGNEPEADITELNCGDAGSGRKSITARSIGRHASCSLAHGRSRSRARKGGAHAA